MRHESNRRKLYETLKREFRADRAVTKVLPMSDFGSGTDNPSETSPKHYYDIFLAG